MVKFTILAGGYSAFITSYLFDTDDNSLQFLSQSGTAGNPSWINSHPTNKSILYATNENSPNGTVQSFIVGHQGDLTLVDTAFVGAIPAYCAGLSEGQVGVASYGTGTARFIPTKSNHLNFAGVGGVWAFPEPTTGTQGVSEAHMIYEYGNEVLVPDKGNDKIWRLGQYEGSIDNYVVHGQIQHPIGSGPRHIRIRDNMLYTIHELSSTLTLQEVPSYPNGTSQILSCVSIIPPDPPAGSVYGGAEILIPNPTSEYCTPYIYVSNRNTAVNDTRGDSIAIFENVNNELVLRNQVYTGLNQVRGMMSGEDAGNGGEAYIVAAGVVNSGVKVFKRTEGGANLQEVAANCEGLSRATFVWLNQN